MQEGGRGGLLIGYFPHQRMVEFLDSLLDIGAYLVAHGAAWVKTAHHCFAHVYHICLQAAPGPPAAALPSTGLSHRGSQPSAARVVTAEEVAIAAGGARSGISSPLHEGVAWVSSGSSGGSSNSSSSWARRPAGRRCPAVLVLPQPASPPAPACQPARPRARHPRRQQP